MHTLIFRLLLFLSGEYLLSRAKNGPKPVKEEWFINKIDNIDVLSSQRPSHVESQGDVNAINSIFTSQDLPGSQDCGRAANYRVDFFLI